MSLILSQLGKAVFIGVDAVACGCIIRRTHNLSYVHEIALYKRDNWPIPLECIDHHWWKLDILFITVPTVEELNYQKNVEVFISSLLKADGESQV